jgi:hypothetical protein
MIETSKFREEIDIINKTVLQHFLSLITLSANIAEQYP